MKTDLCLEFRNVIFHYEDAPDKTILSHVTFSVRKGEVLAILGENGSGKTTILNLISQFLKPTQGSIRRPDQESSRPFSVIIPQGYSLLDWKSVSENIKIGLLSRHLDEHQVQETINDALALLKIKEYADSYPYLLSGGIKQRVVIARALVSDPRLLLLDEPFNSLDIPTKDRIIHDIKRIIKSSQKSAILVTHDVEEAIMMADRILIQDHTTRRIRNIIPNFPSTDKRRLKCDLLTLLHA